MRILFYDLETQHLAQELPNGWQDAELMRVSILGFVSAVWENGSFKNFYTDIVQENNLSHFFSEIENADVLIGWGNGYFNNVLKPFDQKRILSTKKIVDLKDLTHEFSSGAVIPFPHLAQSFGMSKLGKNGIDAVKHYRNGHWYELSRYVLWDLNILPLYWKKIMDSVEGSSLLVQDKDNRQIGVGVGKIKSKILSYLNHQDDLDSFYID